MNIKERRIELQLSQKEVAERLGLRENTYNRYENNRRKMPYRLLPAVAKLLDCKIEEIVFSVTSE